MTRVRCHTVIISTISSRRGEIRCHKCSKIGFRAGRDNTLSNAIRTKCRNFKDSVMGKRATTLALRRFRRVVAGPIATSVRKIEIADPMARIPVTRSQKYGSGRVVQKQRGTTAWNRCGVYVVAGTPQRRRFRITSVPALSRSTRHRHRHSAPALGRGICHEATEPAHFLMPHPSRPLDSTLHRHA